MKYAVTRNFNARFTTLSWCRTPNGCSQTAIVRPVILMTRDWQSCSTDGPERDGKKWEDEKD